jgi:protoporphyrinogen oxidase
MNESRNRPPLRLAIIGAGIAGLTAAYDIAHNSPQPVQVDIFEASSTIGGLAAGFKGRPEWSWPLEKFYHHLFTNDDAIFEFTREIGAEHLLEIHRPVTAMHYQGQDYPFDTPLRLLMFPHLSLVSKIRMGMVLAYLRYHPRPPWRKFDRLLADEWLHRWMGGTAYTTLWRPMLEGKFGPHFQEVNLAWFWARVFKRTPKLGYYRGGFQAFVDHLAERVQQAGVTIRTNQPVQQIRASGSNGYVVETREHGLESYDVVLSTASPGAMQHLMPDLPDSYLAQLGQLKSMGAVVLTVALDRSLTEGVYWINVPKQEGLPFLALVEHTNMIPPQHYAGDHLLYLGNYLDPDHPYFDMSAEELLTEFLPYLPRFNQNFQASWVTGAWIHKAKYAQPVPPVGYADLIPDIRTPLPGVYFASMSQVYPWDRGTNYAVEMGRKVARMIQRDIALQRLQPSAWQTALSSAR